MAYQRMTLERTYRYDQIWMGPCRNVSCTPNNKMFIGNVLRYPWIVNSGSNLPNIVEQGKKRHNNQSSVKDAIFFFSTLPNNGSRIKRKQRRWCMAQRSGIHCNQWHKGLLSSFFAHNLVHLFTNMLGCPCLFSLPRMEQSLVKKLFHLEGLHHNWQSKRMSQDEALWFWDLRPLFLQNV